MGKKETKEVIKNLLGGLIAKGAIALAKLIRSKLLPRAEEKYCKVLQVATEKIANKVVDRVANLKTETDTKKRVRDLYLLKLIKDTLLTVSTSLLETANFICDNVDFKELDDPSEDTLVALAEIPGALENDEDGCGPDGCEIV